MNVPTPLNDATRDERFDRGLEQLLRANPAGLDEIDPELRDVSARMVQLANDAGWITADSEAARARPRQRWRGFHLISNAVAAAAVIGVVAMLAWFGIQYLDDRGVHVGSQPTHEASDLRPASCDRTPRSDADIAAIVRSSEQDVLPFQATNAPEEFPYNESLQVARDWNACLMHQQWDRATAYESDYFIWMVGQYAFPNGTDGMTEAEIANEIRAFHKSLTPIEVPSGVELSSWATQGYVFIQTGRDNQMLVGLDVWAAWLEDGEWQEYWPIVVRIEWDGNEWVIVSTSQDSVPGSPYKPDKNKPITPPEA